MPSKNSRRRKGWMLAIMITALCLILCACSAEKSTDDITKISRSEEHTYENCTGGVRLVSCGTNYSNSRYILVPEEFEGKPVVTIGDSAFAGMNMESITIPDSVNTIESRAFKGCKKLKEVIFGQGLTVLNGESFQNCTSLEKIEIPLGVTAIRGNTFEGCTALKDVVLHNSITEIHAYAFRNCSSLTQIKLPLQISEIRANTFENCKNLQSIEIPHGVYRIAAHAFRNCSSLSEVKVPSTVKEIGSSAFRSCGKLRFITIPRSAQVDERAFKDTPVKISYK